jgi:hypothetical protein
VKEEEEVVVVDVVDETALSWAIAICANNNKTIAINDEYQLLIFFIALFLNTKKQLSINMPLRFFPVSVFISNSFCGYNHKI